MPKTAQDFINDIAQDAALKDAISAALTKDSTAADIIAFASEHGYEFTEADMKDIEAQTKAEMSDEELDKVAGGDWEDTLFCIGWVFISIIFAGPDY